MMISSELIVGNALLAAVEENKQELEFDYFIDYRDRLKDRLEYHQPKEEYTLSSINVYDILDTAYLVTPYLRFKPLDGCYSRFRSIEMPDEKETVETLKRKMNIYFRNTTPKWLQVIISEIKQD